VTVTLSGATPDSVEVSSALLHATRYVYVLLAVVFLFVRLSACLSATTWYRFQFTVRESNASSFLWADFVSMHEEIPLGQKCQIKIPFESRYFTAIDSSSVETVKDRYLLAA